MSGAFFPLAAGPEASTETSTPSVYETVEETVDLAETLSSSEIFALIEALTMGETVTPLASLSATISDALGLSDAARAVLSATLNDSFDLADVSTAEMGVLVSLVDSVMLADSNLTTLTAIGLISETLALAEIIRSVQDGTISDAVGLSQTLTTSVSAYEELFVSAVFSDTATGFGLYTVEISEELGLDDTVLPVASLIAAINEELDFSVSFVFDDTPYYAYSINAANKAISEYTNYGFNSMAVFNGVAYGATSSGLFRLEGSDDAGTRIDWRLRTGLQNLGTGQLKGMDSVYIGHTASGRMVLKCIVVEGAKQIEHWYELQAKDTDMHVQQRIITGKGLKSVYWAFELANLEADSELVLDIVALHPLYFDRRI